MSNSESGAGRQSERSEEETSQNKGVDKRNRAWYDNIVVTATTSSTLKTEQNFEQTNLLLLLEVITKQICEVNS